MYSMTAYASCSEETQWGLFVWECRSVNHRHLDVSLRLPEGFHALENKLRKAAQVCLRGKLDCFLTFKPSSQFKEQSILLDDERVSYLAKMAEEISAKLRNPAPASAMDILGRPDIWLKKEVPLSDFEKVVLDLFVKALDALLVQRSKEGQALKIEISKRIDEIEKTLEPLKKAIPNLLEEQKNKMLARLEVLKTEVDMQRLEQEMVYLAQKTDVSEEIDRLFIHNKEVRDIIEISNKPIGRRLDFLMQELNRELNTLGSKISDVQVTKAVVDMKVFVEQMREQIQNVV